MKEPTIPGLEYEPLEEHTGESKWQFCKCQSCQEKRYRLEHMTSASGQKVGDIRNVGERY